MEENNIFVIIGFDKMTGLIFIPTPGVFATKKEAKFYCDTCSTDTLSFAFKKTIIGSFANVDMKKKGKQNG